MLNKEVGFELAKLLKEKRFDRPTESMYASNGTLTDSVYDFDGWCSAPTIAEIIMWLYEKHGIWIWVERYSTLFRPYAEEIDDERFGKWEGYKYVTIIEAYQEAISYTLKNLIK